MTSAARKEQQRAWVAAKRAAAKASVVPFDLATFIHKDDVDPRAPGVYYSQINGQALAQRALGFWNGFSTQPLTVRLEGIEPRRWKGTLVWRGTTPAIYKGCRPRYNGEALRAIRASHGVGRPIKKVA